MTKYESLLCGCFVGSLNQVYLALGDFALTADSNDSLLGMQV